MSAVRAAAAEDLVAVEGIGPIMADRIREFFDEPHNAENLDRILTHVTLEPMTEVEPSAAPRPADALAAVRRLELGPRIAVRCGRTRLAGEVGPRAAAQLMAARRRTAMRAMQRVAAAHRIAAEAGRRGLRLVLLKFLALHDAGLLEPGSRDASDVDLLVADEDLEAAAALAADLGFRGRSTPDFEHHLPTLEHPELGLLELHRSVPGVRANGREPARLSDLVALCARRRPMAQWLQGDGVPDRHVSVVRRPGQEQISVVGRI